AEEGLGALLALVLADAVVRAGIVAVGRAAGTDELRATGEVEAERSRDARQLLGDGFFRRKLDGPFLGALHESVGLGLRQVPAPGDAPGEVSEGHALLVRSILGGGFDELRELLG